MGSYLLRCKDERGLHALPRGTLSSKGVDMRFRIDGAFDGETFEGRRLLDPNGREQYWNGFEVVEFPLQSALCIAWLTLQDPESGYDRFEVTKNRLSMHTPEYGGWEDFSIIDEWCAIGSYDWCWEQA